MIQKNGMHGFTNVVVATERKTQVTNAAADMCTRQMLLDPSGSLDKICRITVVYENTVAFYANLFPGDIITRINGRDIYTPSEIQSLGFDYYSIGR